MKYIAVLPWIYRPYYRDCVATMHPDFLANTLIIDNSQVNRGIMWSHNQGMKKVIEEKADWLIILSAAIRFGEAGGLDFIDVLERHSDHYVIHAASNNVRGGLQHKPEGKDEVNKVKGWHLSGFSRECLENIGGWDENLSPYGLCDIDMSLRIQKFYKGAPGWNTYPCDVSDAGMSHSINMANVKSAYPPRNSYFKRKWDREGGECQNMGYNLPFNDSTKDLKYWPLPDDPRSIHNNEFATGEWKYED